MDETAEEREQKLDKAYETVKTSLAEEKMEFEKAAEELESRANLMKEEVRKNIRELEKPITPQEMFLASQSAWALGQVFRLGARMTKELEFVYASNYAALKDSIRIEKQLPRRVALNLDEAIARYEKSLQGRLMSDEDRAMLKFFWNYFMGDKQ